MDNESLSNTNSLNKKKSERKDNPSFQDDIVLIRKSKEPHKSYVVIDPFIMRMLNARPKLFFQDCKTVTKSRILSKNERDSLINDKDAMLLSVGKKASFRHK